ncbi:unnamed protein product [Microthlaspi erraticum]|uniref:F-box domain-containing protein n=1 Tax=Microthlaspi erraticum TaxID=1685480 RepID=A0A6D2IAI3_9BRAS|nr:unnamed protein product [Microthlaspi erraticum]
MAVISEIPEDSNGDHSNPNKKPQDAKKKLREPDERYSFPIPDEVTEKCFALVERCHYPELSLVSDTFRRLINSPTLYNTRSRLGQTESVLYVYLGFTGYERLSWYILHRKPSRNVPNTFSLRLGKIGTLPPMPWGAAVVSVGYEMYVFGGCVGQKEVPTKGTKEVIVIDCRLHTHRSLPSMKLNRSRAAAGLIDGKIYVIGGCQTRSGHYIETFDVREQVWVRTKWSQPRNNLFYTYAVMEEQVFILGKKKLFAYEPKEGKLRRILAGELCLRWHMSSCMIDDMLFSFNPQRVFENMAPEPIIVYDPKEKEWRPWTGLQGFPYNIFLHESKMGNLGGNLVILGNDRSHQSQGFGGKKYIWCVEISLERGQGGEISGKVESVAVVLTVPEWQASIELCRTVTV